MLLSVAVMTGCKSTCVHHEEQWGLFHPGACHASITALQLMYCLHCCVCRYCQARFARGVEFLPLDLANNAPKARVPALAYIPPPLQASSWGWYPEWQKIWDGWGMPAYSL
jgi:hypothetical protein